MPVVLVSESLIADECTTLMRSSEALDAEMDCSAGRGLKGLSERARY